MARFTPPYPRSNKISLSGASIAEEDEELLMALEDKMENSDEKMMYASSDDADSNEAEMAKRGGKARYRRW